MSGANAGGGADPGVKTYWDAKVNSLATIVLPGDHYVSDRADLALVTLLGSCVAACIRDTEMGLGGLNHFLLPDGGESSGGQRSLRYGVYAMEALINDIIKRGGRKDRLEAKVFGGGNVIDTSSQRTVGDKNSSFVLEYLEREGVPVTARDLGGTRARRIFFFPTNGRVSVLRLEPTVVRDQEIRLKDRVEKAPKAGTVELFV